MAWWKSYVLLFVWGCIYLILRPTMIKCYFVFFNYVLNKKEGVLTFCLFYIGLFHRAIWSSASCPRAMTNAGVWDQPTNAPVGGRSTPPTVVCFCLFFFSPLTWHPPLYINNTRLGHGNLVVQISPFRTRGAAGLTLIWVLTRWGRPVFLELRCRATTLAMWPVSLAKQTT